MFFAEEPARGAPAPRRANAGCVATLVLSVGLALLFPTLLNPAFHMLRARSWIAVPCTIIRSGVERHQGSRGSTYSIRVSYGYDLNHIHFIGTRYDFSLGSSSGYGYRQRIVEGLTPGSRRVCYVDPLNPGQAVLERGPSRDLLFCLIPLAFLVAGGAMLRSAVKQEIRWPQRRY